MAEEIEGDASHKAFAFLRGQDGKTVNAQQIAEATGWEQATVQTYIHKLSRSGWRGSVHERRILIG